jgi:peptide/nickel transport system permease protein
VLPGIVLATLVFSAIFAGSLTPYGPTKNSLRERNTPPVWIDGGSSKHWLGTDHVGRDVLTRLIHGARISLVVMAIALASGLVIGVTLGLLAGYYGRWIDEVILRIVDIWHALPFLLVALVVVVVSNKAQWPVSQQVIVMGLLALLTWSNFVRNIRAEVLVLKEREFIQYAKLAGASDIRIVWRHLLPSVFNTTIVLATLSTGGLILAEASLSFLGAGIPSPRPAWGVMVAEARDYVATAWWLAFFPGMAIFLVVMSLNFMGDWLRDRLDPRLRQLS